MFEERLTIEPKQAEYLSFFLVKKINSETSTQGLVSILEILLTYNVRLYVEANCLEEYKSRLTAENKLENLYPFSEEDEKNIDLMIVVGGDGTILWALQYFYHRISPPVVGFGGGTLGFLCNFSIKNYSTTIKSLMEKIINKKSFLFEKRTRLRCEVTSKGSDSKKVIQSLNEITIDRGCNPNVILLDSFIEGKTLASFEGDGVIISTPTGSTAYQLSAGGPIINIHLPSISITPLNSVLLGTKPLILPPEYKIKIAVNPKSRKNAFLSSDGQFKAEISADTIAEISGSEYFVPFLLEDGKDSLDNWIHRLRNHLGWNQKRNNGSDD